MEEELEEHEEEEEELVVPRAPPPPPLLLPPFFPPRRLALRCDEVEEDETATLNLFLCIFSKVTFWWVFKKWAGSNTTYHILIRHELGQKCWNFFKNKKHKKILEGKKIHI